VTLVIFHTLKSFQRTEQILREANMEIIFKSKRAEVPLDEMSDEERESWLVFQQKRLVMNSSNLKQSINSGKETLAFLSDSFEIIEKIQKMSQNEPDYRQIEEMIQACIKKHSHLRSYFGYNRMVDLLEYKLPSMLNSAEITCTTIIAKKGENWLRYLRALKNEDPIVTISGSDAEQIRTLFEDA